MGGCVPKNSKQTIAYYQYAQKTLKNINVQNPQNCQYQQQQNQCKNCNFYIQQDQRTLYYGTGAQNLIIAGGGPEPTTGVGLRMDEKTPGGRIYFEDFNKKNVQPGQNLAVPLEDQKRCSIIKDTDSILFMQNEIRSPRKRKNINSATIKNIKRNSEFDDIDQLCLDDCLSTKNTQDKKSKIQQKIVLGKILDLDNNKSYILKNGNHSSIIRRINERISADGQLQIFNGGRHMHTGQQTHSGGFSNNVTNLGYVQPPELSNQSKLNCAR